MTNNGTLQQLADWRKRKDELVWEQEELDGELAGLLAKAKKEGVRVEDMAATLGITRQAVYYRLDKA